MQRLDTGEANFARRLEQLTAWQESLDREVAETVTAIIADVRARGDAAVLELTARFDGLQALIDQMDEDSRQARAILARI